MAGDGGADWQRSGVIRRAFFSCEAAPGSLLQRRTIPSTSFISVVVAVDVRIATLYQECAFAVP